MPVAPGTRLGPYVVNALIGAGGMGEVYRATDTNLARSVAIKVWPESMAADADRVARFDREARTLAGLNHPDIALIFGVERSDGQLALVMELVEGETLAERIGRGPIPLDEALIIARQLASALEAGPRPRQPRASTRRQEVVTVFTDAGFRWALPHHSRPSRPPLEGSAPEQASSASRLTGSDSSKVVRSTHPQPARP